VQKIVCPVCKIEYTSTAKYGIYGFDSFMKSVGAKLEYTELLHHMRLLAHNANLIRIGQEERHKTTTSPIKGLFALLGSAKYFVHFSTYGLGEQILGAMKIVAQSIPVRGIVSNVNEYLEAE